MSTTAFENRQVGDLTSGAQFVLWCLRARVECERTGEPADKRLGRAFKLAQIPGYELHFERIFRWVNTTAWRTVRVGCLKCCRVTSEEALLLSALAAYQADNADAGQILFACLLPKAAARNLTVAARRLTEGLRMADLPIGVNAQADEPDETAPDLQPETHDPVPPGLLAPTSNLVH